MALGGELSRSYAGGDFDLAARAGALVLALGSVASASCLIVKPPTAQIGGAGWIVAGVSTLIAAVAIVLMFRRPQMFSWNKLLVGDYLSVAAIANVEWLAGGRPSPFHQLFMLAFLHAAAVHPPRRVIPFAVFAGACVFLPLAYQGGDGAQAAEMGTQVLILCFVALITTRTMCTVRDQRLAARAQTDEAEERGRIDALTGLFNRRAFDEALPAAATRAQTANSRLAVLVADVDDFKAINDRWGHLEGDDCLREVGRALRRAVREDDHCFRWGGDEFAVILPGALPSAAERAAARIHAALSYSTPNGEPVTVTIGHSHFAEGTEPEELMHAADMALMAGKASRASANLG